MKFLVPLRAMVPRQLIKFFLVHADTVVFDNDSLAFLVHRNIDAELRALRQEFCVRKREETALVECVRRVRNELAQEDFLVVCKGN
jgi:hypothetical protein